MAADRVLARTEDLSMEWESPTGDQERMLTSLLQLMVCIGSSALCAPPMPEQTICAHAAALGMS